MSKTVELRKVVTGLLKTTGREVFYENATNKAKFPYIVYEFDTVDFGNYWSAGYLMCGSRTGNR